MIPLFFLLVAVFSSSFEENLPAVKLDLASFKKPITLVEGNGADEYNMLYQHLLDEKHFERESTPHLLPRMLDLVKL